MQYYNLCTVLISSQSLRRFRWRHSFFLGTLAHRAQARQPLFWSGHSEKMRKRKRPDSTDKTWNWTSGGEPCASHWVIRRLDQLLCESECFPERNMAVTQWYVKKRFAFLEKNIPYVFFPNTSHTEVSWGRLPQSGMFHSPPVSTEQLTRSPASWTGSLERLGG